MEEFTSGRAKHGDVNATNSYTDYRQFEGLVEGAHPRRGGTATLACPKARGGAIPLMGMWVTETAAPSGRRGPNAR
ncbi:hypothetical protein GmRootA79_49030 [Acidovorax sp. A79]